MTLETLSEVLGKVAPDAVDMSAAVTRVVVFEQEGRTLQTIIVWVLGFERACPGEGKTFDARCLQPFQMGGGNQIGQSIEIFVNDLKNERLPVGAESGGLDPKVFQRRNVRLVLCDVTPRRILL